MGSELEKVTSHETSELKTSVLLVVSDTVVLVVLLVTVFVYTCPLTAFAAVQPVPVYSWTVSVPFSGAPPTELTLALSLGTQDWADELTVVSLTVKHSPELASLDPV